MPSLLGALRAALCATLVVGAPRGAASSCSTEHTALLGRMERADSTVAALAEEMRTFRVEAEGRTSALETQVEELKQAMASGESERRRAQRMGGAETAHIITIETTAAFCAPSTGRPRLADCQNPSFERCHHAICVPILEGHRRLQDEACTPQTLQARTAAVTAACCLAEQDCERGHPRTCTPDCAGVFLAWWDDCEVALGKDGRRFEATVEMCETAIGTGASLAMQLGVQCTGAEVSDRNCIPECTEELHGYVMLLNIDGDDMKLSCQLHHDVYSWVGGAVRCTQALSFLPLSLSLSPHTPSHH
jgi:hypothetical protein